MTSTAISNVKGHATQKQVDDGDVKEEDKAGNDRADEAAGKGAKEAQESLADLVATYSGKHRGYKALLERIHVFMLKMAEAEKEARQKLEQETAVRSFVEGENAGARKGREKIQCKNLTYFEQGQGRHRETLAVRRVYCKNDEEHKDMQHMANFLVNVEWSENC